MKDSAKKHAKKEGSPAQATAETSANQAPPSSEPPRKIEVKITAAKGRPMLTWVGKRPLSQVTAFPAQHVEAFDPSGSFGRSPTNPSAWKEWPESYLKGGLLFHGDNKEVLAHLLANGFRGKVKLIYIDPPFDSGADYVRKVSLRGARGTAKIDGESYTLGEQIQYTDIWANDNYLQFMYERLLMLKELLAENGSIYLHCDQRKQHLLRCLMDEIFGVAGFRNEIVRIKCNPKNFEREAFGNIHDLLLFYSKGDHPEWNDQMEKIESEDMERLFPKTDPSGRRYTTVALHAAGTRKGPTGDPWRGIMPPSGRHWAYVPEVLDELDSKGLIEWSSSGNPRMILYAHEQGNRRVQDIWTMKDPIYPTYPTEKNEAVVERIILSSSAPGDLVLDCFIGSGTTAVVAQELGRRWIGCDINKGAIQTTSKRLQAVIQEQIDGGKGKAGKNEMLPGMETDDQKKKNPEPAQLGFTVWRVNDYDLAIQHNEAVNLACDHIGVQRTRTDSYFDGTLGKSLVKIISFSHPLTPLDLEELRRELDSRPEEDRPITLICLGMELASKTWIEEWNRLRKAKNAVNRISVIELRTDPKYGRFIKHEPACAKVRIARVSKKLFVEIEDFVSPTIVERLQHQAGLLQPQIDDWRVKVDCVMIDPAYDGKVFNVALSDVPEKKTDLVAGRYELPAPDGKTTVSVKLIDMLGEEVLVAKTV